MLIKEIKKIGLCLAIMCLILFAMNTISFAVGFSASASKSSLTVGESTTLTVTVSDCEGKFSFSSSDSNVASVSSSGSWIGDSGNTYNLTVTAKKAGKATITITASDVSDKSFNEVTGSKTVAITVSEPANNNNNNSGGTTQNNKSSDNSLKSITVGGKTYSNPKKDITAPKLSASSNSIEIKAQANDSKAKITGTGIKELVTGTNKFTITVTAENGAKANYIVRVTKLAEEKDEPNVVDETPNPEPTPEETPIQNLRLSSLQIEGVELIPTFDSEVFEYSIFITDIEELAVTALSNMEGANVEVKGNTGLVEGENLLTITLTKDEQVVEYKVTVNKVGNTVFEETNQIQNEEDKKETKGIIGIIGDWWNKSGPMAVIFTGVLLLFGVAVIFAIISYKYSNPVANASKHGREEFSSNEELISGTKK